MLYGIAYWQESEARTELLRQKSQHHDSSDLELPGSSATQRHINFFEDLEQGVSEVPVIYSYALRLQSLKHMTKTSIQTPLTVKDCR